MTEARLSLGHRDLERLSSGVIQEWSKKAIWLDLSDNRVQYDSLPSNVLTLYRDLSDLRHFVVMECLVLDGNGLGTHLKLPYLPVRFPTFLTTLLLSSLPFCLSLFASNEPEMFSDVIPN